MVDLRRFFRGREVDAVDLDAAGSIEPILAWRAWTVALVDGRFRLGSVAVPTMWEPNVALEATCLRIGWKWMRRAPYRHAAPHIGCSCGIYGSADLASAISYALEYIPSWETNAGPRVVGRVALWGNVASCGRGWRASLAYPWEVVVPEQLYRHNAVAPLEAVACDLTDYDVRVTVVDELELARLIPAATS